jgi:hypothetical protein
MAEFAGACARLTSLSGIAAEALPDTIAVLVTDQSPLHGNPMTRAFACFRVPEYALNGPYWFVGMWHEEGYPEPVEPLQMFATEDECQLERDRLAAAEKLVEGP